MNSASQTSEAPAVDEIPGLIRELYKIVERLEAIFPGRHFTPDGHLVGSIGEALASHYYGVELTKASTEGFDGVRDGVKVEVKATQGKAVALSSRPEHLIVFKLLKSGGFEECFNGPGALAWKLLEKRAPTKNGQHMVSLVALSRVMSTQVSANEVLAPVLDLPQGTKRCAAGLEKA
jgi:hypothetical protein